MANIKLTLRDGLKLDEVPQVEAELREPTAGDILDAQAESERLMVTPDGYQLVASPAQTAINVLRRQVVKIGGIPGPLTPELLKKLSARDLRSLNAKAAELELAAFQEVAQRGRAQETR